MLNLRLRSTDQLLDWHASENGWSAGGSFLRPYKHQVLEFDAIRTEGAVAFVLRERFRGASRPVKPALIAEPRRVSQDAFSAWIADCRAWPLDFQLIEFTKSGNGLQVCISAGLWGTAPLFLLEADGCLWGSWDPTTLYPLLGPDPFDVPRLAMFLSRLEWPYSKDTMFTGLKMVTERAKAQWGCGAAGPTGLRFDYPPATEQPFPRRLKENVDVIGAFESIVAASMSRWLDAEDSVAVTELSGGLDSSTVSVIASSLTRQPLRSHGMIMPGENGIPQQARRQELARRFGFIDDSFPASENPPLSFDSRRLEARDVIPWEDFYAEAVERLLASARQHNSVIFTGIGGDELSALYYEEMTEQARECNRSVVFCKRDDAPSFLTDTGYEAYLTAAHSDTRAPRGPTVQSNLEEAASVSTLYLRSGMWPVSPLATPELVWFCRTLPLEWRDKRVMQREFLIRKGCSRDVAYPAVPESFASLMDLSLRETAQPHLLRLFRESRLAEMGLVDCDELLAAYGRYVDHGGRMYEEPIYSAAMLELTVRSVESARGSRPPLL